MSPRKARRASVLFRIPLLAAAALVAITLLSSVSWAGGAVDQTLEGDPPCQDFEGFVSGGFLRQEFVPSQPVLFGFDLCLGHPGEGSFIVNVRRGSALDPGPRIATQVRDLPQPAGKAYIEIDLATPVIVDPGEKLVIELPETSTFAWYATCSQVLNACTQVNHDLYPEGEPNVGPPIGDFAFRSAGSPLDPDWYIWGDDDCGLSVQAVDALAKLRFIAGLSVQQEEPCLPIESTHFFLPAGYLLEGAWGDADCDGDVDAVDALSVLRYIASLDPFDLALECPPVGGVVRIDIEPRQ